MKRLETVTLEQLIALFEESSLTELEIDDGEFSVRMKRGGSAQNEVVPIVSPVVSSTQEPVEETETITSPIVGTFYLTPAPDAPPYVGTGSRVEAGDVIATIEAMKLMNQLEAEFACEIVSILARPETMVEVGQPLFAVRRL
jgi:acetyl-CoA carboxylase biotin carboxyl carrier protein